MSDVMFSDAEVRQFVAGLFRDAQRMTRGASIMAEMGEHGIDGPRTRLIVVPTPSRHVRALERQATVLLSAVEQHEQIERAKDVWWLNDRVTIGASR